MAAVEFRNVRNAFGAVEVLHGVSVDIADSEFVVLVEPSVYSQSTLLRMLVGLEVEPPRSDNPLLQMPQVVLSPHNASASSDSTPCGSAA